GAPNRKMTLREALPGSIVIFVLWFLFSWLCSLYVTYAARYSLLYGSLCGVIVLLLWLYFFGVLLMVGAELNGILMTNGSWRERQRLRIKQTDPPAQSAEQADNPA
ncbi:MAG: YihY/virulence factor BrkB family protein, partial [Clostridia bacterium]|nr:YihY/virulence factor BrkB family protein [Clostridia bacterium]